MRSYFKPFVDKCLFIKGKFCPKKSQVPDVTLCIQTPHTYSKLLKFLSISGQGVIQEFAGEAVKHELGISNNRAEVFGSLCMPKVSPIGRLNALKITKNKLLNLYLLSDTLLDI